MSRMIDLIRASAVPANLVQSAAKGSLSVPSGEMIEILVHLAVNNRVFSEQAQLTLAGWDESGITHSGQRSCNSERSIGLPDFAEESASRIAPGFAGKPIGVGRGANRTRAQGQSRLGRDIAEERSR